MLAVIKIPNMLDDGYDLKISEAVTVYGVGTEFEFENINYKIDRVSIAAIAKTQVAFILLRHSSQETFVTPEMEQLVVDHYLADGVQMRDIGLEP